MSKKTGLIIFSVLAILAASAALTRALAPQWFILPSLSSSIEDSSSVESSEIEASSSIEESSSEVVSSEDPSSSEEIPEDPTIPLPSYMSGEPESEPVDDDLNTFTGFTSGYKDQYSTADDPDGSESRYFGAGVQEASNITSLGWTTTSSPNMSHLIQEVNALSASKYVFIATNYWVSIPSMAISIGYGTASASTYQALVAIREYLGEGSVSPWEILIGPGSTTQILASAGGVIDVDYPSETGIYQILFGFMSPNSTASVRNWHLSIDLGA